MARSKRAVGPALRPDRMARGNRESLGVGVGLSSDRTAAKSEPDGIRTADMRSEDANTPEITKSAPVPLFFACPAFLRDLGGAAGMWLSLGFPAVDQAAGSRRGKRRLEVWS